MELRKVFAGAMLVVLLVPSLAAAYHSSATYAPRATETLVEGHTVFSVLQQEVCVRKRPDGKAEEVPCPPVRPFDAERSSVHLAVNVTVQRLGAAVAVLVRDRVKTVTPPPTDACATNRDVVVSLFQEMPGVLWFNDQFLVGDDLDLAEVDVDANVDVCTRRATIALEAGTTWRHPCGGWVVATQAGNPDPRQVPTALWVYQESYLVTDPNDRAWHIDKYQALNPLFAVGPPAAFVQESFPLPDGSTANVTVYAPPPDRYAFFPPFYALWVVPILDNAVVDPGPTTGAGCAPITDAATADPAFAMKARYNAVLFFFFEDLVARGAKDHGAGGAHDPTDASFCEAGTEWTCPAGGDDAEGNSHPYNDASTTSGPRHAHASALVDLYYHNVAPPPIPAPGRAYAVYDTVGSTAFRHFHDPAEQFDDRVHVNGTFEGCVDPEPPAPDVGCSGPVYGP